MTNNLYRVEINNAYSEIFELLKKISKKDLVKIPIEYVETIKENKNNEYVPEIDLNNLSESLSLKAKELYLWLYLTYILDNEEEKTKIYKTLYKNENQLHEDIRTYEKMFKFKDEKKIQSNELIEYKQNFCTKIISKILNFFKRK